MGELSLCILSSGAEAIKDELSYDPDRRLWRASVKQALRDSRVTGRSKDLIKLEETHEFI